MAALRAGGSGVTHSPRIRQVLVVCQVAMTVVLLCGAGLLARTMLALNRADNGVDKHDVLTMEVALPASRYTNERRVIFYQEAGAGASGTARRRDAAPPPTACRSSARPGAARSSTSSARRELPLSESPSATIRVVTPGYFRTMRDSRSARARVHRGRRHQPEPGFVVNEAFVKTYFADDRPAVGVDVGVDARTTTRTCPIIGVVGDVSEGSVRDTPQPTIFYNHRGLTVTAMTLFVRTRIAPNRWPGRRWRPCSAIDPNLAVTKVRTFEGAVAESLARERLNALVSGGFALSALLLSSLGLYGLLAFLVTERTKEIGIRIALGARLCAPGGIGGRRRASAWSPSARRSASRCRSLLLRSFGALLFGVSPYDPPTYAAVVATAWRSWPWRPTSPPAARRASSRWSR